VTSPSVELLLERLAGFVTADERAGQCPADLDVAAADRLAPEHRIKRHDLEHIDRLQLQLRRDPRNRVLGNEAHVLLDEVQQWQRRAALRRVMGDYLVDFRKSFGLEIH
jgi:hypothetical protein